MEEERIKMEEDMSAIVDAQLPECERLAQSGKQAEALEGLLALEKQTRTAADLASLCRVLVVIVKVLRAANDWAGLNEHIVLLSKKRGQLKQGIAKLVQEAMALLDETPDKATKLALIETLRTVTEGKIFVEIERARLTRLLSNIYEAEGRIAEAADVLQQLQVETFGSMDKREKTDFLLEQLRLLLAKNDFVRAQLVSNKISTRYFEKEETHDLKIRYYELMVIYARHEKQYLDVCKHFRAIADTPHIAADETRWKAALKCAAVYVVLAPFDNEQSDLLHRIAVDKKLAELPLYRDLLKAFTTIELIKWSAFEARFKADILSLPQVQEHGAQAVWDTMRERLIEHNIRILSTYYERIRSNRLAELLDLSEAETEAFLSRLVVSKTIYARIDRPAGIVTFARKQDPNEILTGWATSISSLLQLVERATHLIAKEEMVHQIKATS